MINNTLIKCSDMPYKRYIFLAIQLLILTSCAGLNSQRMVADVPISDFSTGQSISKIEVRGEREEVFGGAAFAKKDQILSAITDSLRISGLFNSVNKGDGDLVLQVVVRSQSQKVSSMLEYRAVTTITYRFVNAAEDVIWSSTYETEFSSHAFSGATRTMEAREGSVRENIAALVEDIRKRWKKDNQDS